jgi:hypothetical protein
MIGPAALHLSKFFILAGLAACPAQGRVNADVHMDKIDSPYVTTLTARELTQKFSGDLNTTMATDGKWMVSGVTVLGPEGLRTEYSVQFNVLSNRTTRQTCLSIKDVQYTIKYAPVIYIASDYLDKGCRYGATVQHERRHVETDVWTINNYIPQIRNAIAEAAESIGPQAPFPAGEIAQQQERLIKTVAAKIRPAWDALLKTRQTRQAAIDTKQNYLRDTALCPGQFPDFDGGK